MPEQAEHEWARIVAILLFAIGLLFFGFMAASGYAWYILSIPQFSLSLILFAILLAVTAGAVGTYSFVSFSQTREIRSLMLMLMGINIILWSFLFLVTHPSSIDWSITFSSRPRNRTLGMAFVLIIVPPLLLSSFSSGMKPSRSSSIFLVVWGVIITPFISLWFFLSPEPVFLMTYPEGGGLEGITPIGIVISMGYLLSQIVALLRIAQRYRKTRDTLDLTLMLALTHWIAGTFFIIVLWNPLQIAELLWIASMVTGYLLIAAVQFVTSILDPHRVLESLLEERTMESEYYLNMWTHKMGNLLQGLVTYLDVLENAEQGSIDDRDSRAAARLLSREAILVNHQVLQLTSVKEGLHQELKLLDIGKAVSNAVESAESLLGKDVFNYEYPENERFLVVADDMVSLLFLNNIIFNVRNKTEDPVNISISFKHTNISRSVYIRTNAKPIPFDVQELLQHPGLSGSLALGLDLFTIKLLMNRYGGRIECVSTDASGMNLCIYHFPSIK